MKNLLTVAIVLATALLAVSCRNKEEADTGPPPVLDPSLTDNQLKPDDSPFLASAADSPIHWQNWDPQLIAKATEARRLIFVLVGSARYPGCYETLRTLDQDSALIRKLNEEYIPVLADLDIARETGLMAYAMSPETGSPISFPFLLLLSPEGSPVSWQPILYSADDSIRQFFENSMDVMTSLWRESPEYVAQDSRGKLASRRDKLPKADPIRTDAAERQALAEAAVRKLLSSYDSDLGAFSDAGGLFPFGVFDLLTFTAFDPSLPEDVRTGSVKTLADFEPHILRSAMIDPLDGGVYPSRRGVSWDLPLLKRDCITQARVGRIFAKVHQLNGSTDALEAAVGAVRFAEQNFATPDGFFSLTGVPASIPSSEWLWTVEQIAEVLSEPEQAAWRVRSQLDPLGNLPSEADPGRRFFRRNSLARRATIGEVAGELEIDPAAAAALLDSGAAKLLAAREKRFPSPARNDIPSANACFRMTSAYASLFAATGDPAWSEKAVALGTLSKERFHSSGLLNERPDNPAAGASDGRAFTYAVAIQAALDLAAVTLDESWARWAADLTAVFAEEFVTSENKLLEVRQASEVVDLDFDDRTMVFDDSSAGLMRQNLARLEVPGFGIPAPLATWRSTLPPVDKFPMIFTDTLAGLALEWTASTVLVDPAAAPEITLAVSRLPIDIFRRRLAEGAPTRLVGPDGENPTPLPDIDAVHQLAAPK